MIKEVKGITQYILVSMNIFLFEHIHVLHRVYGALIDICLIIK